MDNKKTDSKEIRKKNVSDGNAKHLRRINEITISVSLKPEEVIKIAKDYHEINILEGNVNEDFGQLFFDEEYTFKIDLNNRKNDDKRSAWRVKVNLPENSFLYEDYTLIVSDKDRKVMGMLDPNGHPVFDGNEFSDEDIKYIMDDDNNDNDDDDNWKKVLKSFDDE